ncbi:hypothetical protein XENOCAPTIV_022378 [Xenoophorus captivus]|uniref:Uncharacterized protein n=1 Tax=Xenoophorus captivus TaxID=1517983 RepID=A0ABV0QLV0_9TELE
METSQTNLTGIESFFPGENYRKLQEFGRMCKLSPDINIKSNNILKNIINQGNKRYFLQKLPLFSDSENTFFDFKEAIVGIRVNYRFHSSHPGICPDIFPLHTFRFSILVIWSNNEDKTAFKNIQI